jgi:hypothetical protein
MEIISPLSPSPSPLPLEALPPNWTEIVTAVASVVALIGVFVGAWIALSQTGEAVRTRTSSLMADLSRRWDEPLLAESRRLAASYSRDGLADRVEYLQEENHPELDVLFRAPNFLEDVAVLEQSGSLPFDMIRKSLGGTVISEWEHWEPTVLRLRGDQRYDLVYENFELLHTKMKAELAKFDLPGTD